MIGITSFGGYLPRLRLNRMSIVQNIGWLIPAIAAVAQGERSFCNWDEDSLTMAVESSRDCLSGIDRKRIDALYLASTTLPFSDRLNAGILSTALNLRSDILTSDFASGLRAGTSALIAALDAVQSGDKKDVLVAATDRRETKAASFYEMWFGDGAASLLLGTEDVIAEFEGAHSVSYDFVSHYRGAGKRFDYTWEERWVRDEGYVKIIPEAIQGLLTKASLSIDDVNKVVYPCFFKRDHAKIGKIIGANPEKITDNMHDICGDTGTAHPLLMLIRTLEESEPGDRIVVAGFGQGCDALCFKVTENISELPSRTGITGSLEQGITTENYLKFLKFRDLILTETGIRAEAPTQTALSTLWRNRKMLLGLVGGICTKCNTPQYPKMEICVNPDCQAVNTQQDYEFADKSAHVKSFTGDMLAVSVSPPAIYGMVQFEGGGRLMADFTDCDLSALKVGQPAKMAFRKHHTDEERGFTGYFWKAVPEPVKDEKSQAQEKVSAEEKAIRFDGQVAVVTGAGRGLGRAHALELAKRGAKVVVNDFGGAISGEDKGSKSPADDVVQEIVAAGGEAVANYDSVATVEGGANIIKTAVDQFGQIDILINNAGILRDKTLAKMEPDMWYGVQDVHLHGAYNVSRPAFQIMRERGYGRIVFTTSASGLFGNYGQTNYAAAKMGLVGLMNSLKLEGEKHNIKVNTVSPFASTRMSQGLMPDDMAEKVKPEMISPLILYLCSQACSDTGLILNAGGGFFSRAAMVSGAGTALGDEESIPTLEDIHKNWEAIDKLGNQPFSDATAALLYMMEPPKEEEADAADVVEDKARIQSIVEMLPQSLNKEAAQAEKVIFQFSVSGDQGGEWNIAVEEGSCQVEEGVHSGPDATFKMKDEDFLKMVSGQLTGSQAYATGKLKIEGNIIKAQLFEKLFKL